LTGKTRLWHDL